MCKHVLITLLRHDSSGKLSRAKNKAWLYSPKLKQMTTDMDSTEDNKPKWLARLSRNDTDEPKTMLGAFKNERLHKRELEFRLEANLFNTIAFST